ncbi:MAG: chromate resistance protein [Magnetococcales bacterium]|nr:chromate resistance protein [Magnetococcales bacterium]MBF0322800.1 chromate resistance protein [Magnetococcales bacterium]
MKWMTRSHVHVDRVACPWLIARFIDSEAEFLFVSKSRVLEEAAKEGAISYDSPGAMYDHDGDLCTFDVLIRAYQLTDKALLRLAQVVNGADTHRYDKDPLARGLEAIATGYGLRFPDDRENIARQFELYDALYAWCALDTAKGP